MSYKQERIDIQSFYIDNFYINHQIDTFFSNKANDIKNSKEWIRITINNLESKQITINRDHPETEIPGIITFQIFTQNDIGEARGLEIADELIEVFSRKQIGQSIRTYSESLDVIGINRNAGKWFQVNLDINFKRYKRH